MPVESCIWIVGSFFHNHVVVKGPCFKYYFKLLNRVIALQAVFDFPLVQQVSVAKQLDSKSS